MTVVNTGKHQLLQLQVMKCLLHRRLIINIKQTIST